MYTEDERDGVYCVIGSASAGNANDAALETIFHEASHSLVFPDYGSVANAIDAAAKAQKRRAPDGLWHAVIFYTAGQLTADVLRDHGDPAYVAFADKAGLWNGDWAAYRPPLERYWGAYMRGAGTLEAALHACLEAIA